MNSSNDSSSSDYYAVLSLSPSATYADIKAAYHGALLAFHPDKHAASSKRDIDIGLLKEAFQTLHTPELREIYDASRARDGKQIGPRPAQVVSLEEFDEQSEARWSYPCRCGGTYIVTGEILDVGQHLIGCTSCSEVIWVGYELVQEGETRDVQS